MLLIPIGDENYGDRRPYVNYVLIGLNVLVYLFISLPAGKEYENMVIRYGVVPGDLSLVTLFTSMFLHGGLIHLIGNMLFLYIFGDNIERKFGHTGYTFFYLFTGIVAGLAYYVTGEAGRPAIGASGAISGVLGGYLFLFRKNRIKVLYWFYFFIGTFHITALWGIGLWIFWDVISYSFVLGSGVSSGTAHIAHIGGFAAGFGIAAALYLVGIIKLGEKGGAARAGWEKPETEGWHGRMFSHGPQTPGPKAYRPSPVTEKKPDMDGKEVRALAESGNFSELMDSYRRSRIYHGIGTLPRHVEEEIGKRALAEGRFLVAASVFLDLTRHHGSGPNLGYYHGMLGIIHADHLDNFALAYRHLNKAVELGVDATLEPQIEAHIKQLDSFLSEPLLAESPGGTYTLAAIGGAEIPAANVGKLVAARLGRNADDIASRINLTGGMLAEEVPGKQAAQIVAELNREGFPSIAIPQEALLPLPHAEESSFATTLESGIRSRGATGVESLIMWDNIHVANVMQLEGRRSKGIGPSIPSVGSVLDIVTADPAKRIRFSEQNFTPGVGTDGEVRGFDWFILGVVSNLGAGIYGSDVATAALGGPWQRAPQSATSKFEAHTHFLLQRALVRIGRL
ncbi:MAG: rhomboid family intramembrane serine protease [Planctomycetota bacterium]|jgi:membrane associated rhomboid family serine protease